MTVGIVVTVPNKFRPYAVLMFQIVITVPTVITKSGAHPYLDGAIGMLSTLTGFLYDDNSPWAIRVVEAKRGGCRKS